MERVAPERLSGPGEVGSPDPAVPDPAGVVDAPEWESETAEDRLSRRSAELERLRVILEAVADGITVQDAAGRLLYANDSAARMMGFGSPAEALATPASEIMSRFELLDELGNVMSPASLPGRMALLGEPADGVVGYRIRETGEELWSYVKATPVCGPDGRVEAAINVFHDVTARRRAEESVRFLAEASEVLAESLDYERTLGQVAKLAVPSLADWCVVYIVQPDGAIARIAIEHAGGRHETLAELLGPYPLRADADSGVPRVLRSGEPLLVPDLTPRLLTGDLDAPEDVLESLEALGLVSWMCVPLAARGRNLGAISLMSAESGRRFGEAHLHLAQELARRAAVAVDNARLFEAAAERARASQALQFVGDAVVLLDRDAIVRLWNPAAAAMTGLPEAAVVGRPIEEALPGWAALAPRVPVGSAEAPASTRPEALPVEIDGVEHWLSISAVRFAEGTVYAFRDITREIALEKMKSDFVSTVSHELRTPLAAIYGAALTLRREDILLDGGQRDDLLGVIAAEADRLARIVNDILWTSRIESENVQLAIERCDAADLARSVASATRLHLPPGIELDVELPEGLPSIVADPDKVRQVLANLLENAIKYSPDGGSVRLRLESGAGVVRFLVHDEGIGIPLDEHERIFEKFYRLDPGLTRGVGGTGLGLYICRELVRRMDGRIGVRSAPGEGSTFALELPIAELATPAAS